MDARFIDIDCDDDDEHPLDGDHEILSIRISEIEQAARKNHSIPEGDALYLVHHLRAVMADRVSLIRGIAKSAELLGDALDTVDLPDRLVDDLTGDWSGSDSDVVDSFEDLFDDPLGETEARRYCHE